MGIAIGIALCIYNLLMVGATIIGLPGTWLMLAAALGLEFYREGTFSAWTLGIAAGIAIIAEIGEIASGAVGAKVGGASRKAIGAAVIGGIVGAILGTFLIPIPVVGTIAGSALGAGLAASGVELRAEGLEGRDLRRRAARVGASAAAGRLVAVIVKGGLALVMAIQLAIASLA